jgi:hypothetical protein
MPTNFLNFGPELDAVLADARSELIAAGAAATALQKILAGIAGLATALNMQMGLIGEDNEVLINKLDKIQAGVTQLDGKLDEQTSLIKDSIQILSDKLDKVLAWATPPQAETGDLNLSSATLTTLKE